MRIEITMRGNEINIRTPDIKAKINTKYVLTWIEQVNKIVDNALKMLS